MNDILFLKIIDLTKAFGLQVIGLIIIVFLSTFFIQALLWALNWPVKIILFMIKMVFSIILIILNIMPGSLQEKMNKFIVKIESFIRITEKASENVKQWFENAPRKYIKVQVHIVKFIKSAVILFGITSLLVLVFNVFIQKSLTVEQILIYISS